MKQGMFIVIEGADGAGKSTHAKLLAEALRKSGGRVATTTEPTKLPIGQLIRRVLAPDPASADGCIEYDWRTMTLLFTADRMVHADGIERMLAYHQIVICERYYLSTYVYQTAKLYAKYKKRVAHGGDVEAAFVEFDDARRWIKELSSHLPKPDLTVVLDASVSTLADRMAERGHRDRFERDTELMATVAALYREPSRFLAGEQVEVISAEGTQEEVAKRLLETVLRSAPWSSATTGMKEEK